MVSRRRSDGLDKGSMVWSVFLHLAVGGVAWLSTLVQPAQIEFVTYEIELVSPPAAVQAEVARPPTEDIVVERPEPEPTPPEPEVEEIIPVEDPEPEPEPDPPPPDDTPEEMPPSEVADDPVVATTEDPVEDDPPEVSGEGLNVRIEGLKRDYPEYYNNIIQQILRCFRWRDGGNWESVVFFYITRDGRVETMDVRTRSGSRIFDLEAMSANRFGPLPDDLPYERFPVLFRFSPQGDATVVRVQAGSSTQVRFQ